MVGRPMSGLILHISMAALAFGIGETAVYAAPLCAAVVTTPAALEALGGTGCQFDDKVFSNFLYSYTVQDPDGNLLSLDLTGPSVLMQFSNLGGQTNQPVITFTNDGWGVANGNAGDVRITYEVTAPPAAAMVSSSMTLSGFVSNVDPDNQFSAVISGAGSVSFPALPLVSVGVELDPPLTASGLVFQTGFNQVGFDLSTDVFISSDTFISSGSPGGNSAILTQISLGLTEQPEPLSFFLFGGGLVSLVVLSKRLRKLN
jgi:hypothetical protein